MGRRYLVHVGCIKPLCDLLDVNEVKIIKVAMEGLENILKVIFPLTHAPQNAAS